MEEISEQFERALHQMAVRAVKQAVREGVDRHLDDRVGRYIDKYINSDVMHEEMQAAVIEFCRHDSLFIDELRKFVRAIIDDELRQIVAARLQASKVGDKSFSDWLIQTALKESLTSESVKQSIENTIKSHIEDVMRCVMTTGLTGLSGKQ